MNAESKPLSTLVYTELNTHQKEEKHFDLIPHTGGCKISEKVNLLLKALLPSITPSASPPEMVEMFTIAGILWGPSCTGPYESSHPPLSPSASDWRKYRLHQSVWSFHWPAVKHLHLACCETFKTLSFLSQHSSLLNNLSSESEF